ncbi:MAG TPA: DUF167 domain-containing protein [Alphaproteobacteria bacterium]|nr:DUF167 domain-containing protein [Alphaproteobacteria bacterium]
MVATRDGVIVTVKVTPRARREGIEPAGQDAALRIRVTEAPESGKANAAVIALLARHWRVPKASLAMVTGSSSRIKRILVRGDPCVLMNQLKGGPTP